MTLCQVCYRPLRSEKSIAYTVGAVCAQKSYIGLKEELAKALHLSTSNLITDIGRISRRYRRRSRK